MFCIGLYLDGSTGKWAKISRHKKSVSIALLRTLPIAEETPFSFSENRVEEGSYELISGLDSAEVLLRNLQIKLQDQKKIIKSLPFQLEPQIPFPPEEAVVSIQILPGETLKSSKVSFYATKKSSLQNHIDFLKQKKADPDEVSCTPSALWRFSQHFFPHLSDTLILHVGSRMSTLVGISDGKPVFSHFFSLGSEPFASTLEGSGKDPSSIDLLELPPEDSSSLRSLGEQAKKELDRVFTFFFQKQKNPWEHIILTGSFSSFPPLKAFIIQQLPASIQLHECVGEGSYDATTLETYAVAVGLALDGLMQDGHSTRFRQSTFMAPSQKKRKLKLFSSFALACLVLTSTSLLISHMYEDHAKKTLIDQFQTSFALQNKKIDTLEELEAEVSLLESSLKKDKAPYPLALSLPNLSQVLAWLSSHPVLSKASLAEKIGEIDMRKVKYNLLKYPKTSAASLPYMAKVEIEIEIPHVETAKAFREALEKEEVFVDHRKEVSWQAKDSTYLISFFLKPYTRGGKA